MEVVALHRFPVKSLGGDSPESLRPLDRGFSDDRRWMLVDTTGRFISQREHAHLAGYAAAISTDDTLSIRELASDQIIWKSANVRPAHRSPRQVTVWDDTFEAVEVADSASLGERLGLPGARLVYMTGESFRPVDQRYAGADESVSFADGFPYLIANTSSLTDLADRYGADLDMRRFRPNIVIGGAAAYAEDDWAALSIGRHRFDLPKPCARCIMVTNEPDTGARDARVLATLAAYRKRGNKVLFGENGLWRGGEGSLRVGDPVEVLSLRGQ